MEKYTRFFEAVGASFLLESIYVTSYSDLECYAFRKGNTTTILFKDLESKKCGQKAYDLFKDTKKFNQYYNEFSKFLKNAEFKSNQLIIQNKPCELLEVFLAFLKFYRWTESFYTDLSYMNLNESIELKLNLEKLERIKTNARKFLNLFFNGESSYLSRIAKKSDVEEIFLNSTIEEIKYKKKLTNNNLENRKGNHLLDYNHVLYNQNASEYLEVKGWIESFCKSVGKIIKGIGASQGKVTGKAYVLSANFTNFDLLDKIIDDMPSDVILVSETTAPDIVRACHKSKGIVTNQGGLGSHASIISRELKLPCVVGTKSATKLINTGDIITIDGNKGEVIINDRK